MRSYDQHTVKLAPFFRVPLDNARSVNLGPDTHRRTEDDIAADNQIAGNAQRRLNRMAWLVLAVTAIEEGKLDVAISRINQARRECPDCDTGTEDN